MVCLNLLFRTSYLLGEYQDAEQFYLQSLKVESNWGGHLRRLRDHEIGYVYYQLGRTEEAEKIFAEQIQRLESGLNENRRGNLFLLARLFAFIGNGEKALKYLTSFADGGFIWGWHDFILIDPFFESLQDDPEFKAIVKQAQEEKTALREQVREMEANGELNL